MSNDPEQNISAMVPEINSSLAHIKDLKITGHTLLPGSKGKISI
jgi:hypothetical protein